MTEQELIEQLADKEHASWARWMAYLFSKCERGPLPGDLTIPSELCARWEWQAATPYAALPENVKQSDRDEVAHILPIIRQFTTSAHGDVSSSPSPFQALFDA